MIIRLIFSAIVLALLAVPAVQQAIALGLSSRFGFGLLF
jgi:hypothetical protein